MCRTHKVNQKDRKVVADKKWVDHSTKLISHLSRFLANGEARD